MTKLAQMGHRAALLSDDDDRGSLGEDADPVGRGVVWFVRIFLAVTLACAVLGLEAWPFTGFRLFSSLRTESQTVWQADAVGALGRETLVDFNSLPRAYQGFPLLMPGMSSLSSQEQTATCEAFLQELRSRDPSVSALRIYKQSWQELPRSGSRPAQTSRTLVYGCR